MFRYLLCVSLLISLLLPAASHAAVVKTGAEVLAADDYQLLRGKRFALVTNQTAQIGGVHLIERMESDGIRPAVVFTPEHGLRGTVEDGERCSDGIRGNIPIKSLYGAVKKPRPEDLKGIDLILFDIQDIGVRYYTYISTMGLAMEAAAEAGIPFVVLDRPNPLGGDYVAGYVRTELPKTFTSFYQIPMVHGLTVGELASLIKGEAMLPGLDRLELRVIRMQGWQRWMRWPDTGLPFVPTSPNIPTFDTSLLYAGFGLVESTMASEGRGTTDPFHLIGLPGIDDHTLAQRLNGCDLPGLRFDPVHFVPKSIPGKSSDPKYLGREVHGVRITVTDYHSVEPVEAALALLTTLYGVLPEKARADFFWGGFDDMAGSIQLRRQVAKGTSAQEIAAGWEPGVEGFQKTRERYLLYGGAPEPRPADPVPGEQASQPAAAER